MYAENSKINVVLVELEVKKHFPKLWKATEASLATVATLLLKNNANPTSLVLIGPVSSGKSTVLSFFQGLEKITYCTDYFTAKALVTHYANKDKKELDDLDLLKRIKGKSMVVSDLGCIFGSKKDNLRETLGIFTRALDGEGLLTDSGVHGRRGIKGSCMFAMLGGTTPFKYKIWDEMGRFGSRMLFITMPFLEDETNEDIKNDFKGELSYLEKRQFCGGEVNQYLKDLWEETGGFQSIDWDDSSTSSEIMDFIIESARLLSKLRGLVPIWNSSDGEFQYQQPTIEAPHRAISLFLNLAKGRAIINGRRQICINDMALVLDVALSSCPSDRGKIFKALVKSENGTLNTQEVCEVLNVSTKIALRAMENFSILKIVEHYDRKEGVGRPGCVIRLRKEIKEWTETSNFKQYFAENESDIG
ncbi:MAG: hypothetical protein P9L98_00680 [Candidatus Kaelpia imicola]|nr:hypothetical protein [Candidatus Kaelpia imicola]